MTVVLIDAKLISISIVLNLDLVSSLSRVSGIADIDKPTVYINFIALLCDYLRFNVASKYHYSLVRKLIQNGTVTRGWEMWSRAGMGKTNIRLFN